MKNVTEWCSECEYENEFAWDVNEYGYKAYCPHCGAVLMLCSECMWREDTPPKCYAGNLSSDCTRVKTRR